jgi:hypothetical protein
MDLSEHGRENRYDIHFLFVISTRLLITAHMKRIVVPNTYCVVLCFCFVCVRLLYPMLTASLDCPFLIAPSVSSNIYFDRQDSNPIRSCGFFFVLFESPFEKVSLSILQ